MNSIVFDKQESKQNKYRQYQGLLYSSPWTIHINVKINPNGQVLENIYKEKEILPDKFNLNQTNQGWDKIRRNEVWKTF